MTGSVGRRDTNCFVEGRPNATAVTTDWPRNREFSALKSGLPTGLGMPSTEEWVRVVRKFPEVSLGREFINWEFKSVDSH